MLPQIPFRLSSFLGDAQSQSPFLLSEAYSSSGSKNTYIDKLGRIRTLDGWLRQNAAAKKTDTGASDAIWRALYQFTKVAGGVTTRQLLCVLDDGVNEWELHYSTDVGVTFTFVHDFGAGSVGTIPDFAMFGDTLYITNGVIAPQVYDGAAIAAAGGTQLAAPTLTDAGPGNLSGTPKYRIVPITPATSDRPSGRKLASVSSLVINVQNRQVAVAWLADADVTVKGYEVWRTTGSGLDFYLVAYVDGRLTVGYTDTLPDPDLLTKPVMAVVAAHGDAPPVGCYFTFCHKGRVMWFSTDTFPRRCWISDPGVGDSVYTDRMYVEAAGTSGESAIGDTATGGTGEFNGMAVLWLKHSAWVLSGTGRIIGTDIDWRLRKSNAKTGTVHHRTVARVPRGAAYTDQEGKLVAASGNMLAFLTPERDIRLFDGADDTIISFPKSDTLLRMNPTHARKAYSYDDPDHNMLVWVFPIDNATEPNYSVAWNYRYGTWHEWDGTNWGHAVRAEMANGFTLVAGEDRIATGALIYKLWTGDSRDGDPITGVWMSKPVYPAGADYGVYQGQPDYKHIKRLNTLFLLFAKEGAPTDVTVEILEHDAADTDAAQVSRALLAASSILRVPCRQGASDTHPGRFFHGPGFRLRITSTATSGPWVLEALEGEYQILPGTIG